MRLSIRLLFCLLLTAAAAKPAAVSTISLDGDWQFLADPSGRAITQMGGLGGRDLPTPVSEQAILAWWRNWAKDIGIWDGAIAS